MYDTTCTTSSPLPSRQPFDSDEISIFLHHLLHSSSSSSPPSPKPPTLPLPSSHPIFSDDHNRNSDCRVPGTSSSTTESSSGLILSSSGIYFPPDAPIHSLGPSATASPSVAAGSGSGVVAAADCDAVTVSVKRKRFPSENDPEDFECESEEGFETSDGPSKQSQPRGSSKRSRAAEVHNLSEKRRRSRINEKMKALQNLIPNSNKTDKASMLDEAIEYLKQLQVQVQMLSMRNGFSLHPMYLPGAVQPLQLPQMRMAFNEGSRLPPHVNIGRDTLPVNQESSTLTFGLSNQCTTSNQPMITPDMKNITTSETSYGLDSSAQVNQEAFRLPPPDSEEMYGEHILAQQKLYISQSSRSLSEDDKVKVMAAASLPFDSRIPIMEHPGPLKAHVSHRERSQDMLPKDVDSEHILLQQLHRQD